MTLKRANFKLHSSLINKTLVAAIYGYQEKCPLENFLCRKNYREPVLSGRSRDCKKMIFKCGWLLNRGQFTIKMETRSSYDWPLKADCCVIEVTANTGLSVYC